MRGKIPFPHNFTIRELREEPDHQPTVELNESKTGPALDPVITGQPDEEGVAPLTLEVPQPVEQSPIERGMERGLGAARNLENDTLKNVSGLVRDARQATDESSEGSPAQRMATNKGSQAQQSIETIRNAVPKSSIPAPGQSRNPAGPPVQGPRKPTDPPSASESIREHAHCYKSYVSGYFLDSRAMLDYSVIFAGSAEVGGYSCIQLCFDLC